MNPEPETTEQKASRLAQARADNGREHMDAVAAMAAAPKNYPTPVDEAVANSPRVRPFGPVAHGEVRIRRSPVRPCRTRTDEAVEIRIVSS